MFGGNRMDISYISRSSSCSASEGESQWKDRLGAILGNTPFSRTKLLLDTYEDHGVWRSVALATVMSLGHSCVFKCSELP